MRVTGTVTLIILLLCGSGLPAASQEIPASRWWSPSATPEGTRRNDIPTAGQSTSDLVIKWRTSALRGSRTLLVGALSTPSDSREQQIVGMRHGFDTIVVLDRFGFVDTSFSAVVREGSGARAVALTGLFNPDAPSILPEGRPGIIGVALEREVMSSTEEVRQAYGLLLRPDGTVYTRLGLSSVEAGQLLSNQRQDNRSATIYPVALFRPAGRDSAVAFALLSQDRFYHDSTTVPTDVWINSLRTYAVSSAPPQYVRPSGTPFRIAPRTWSSQPAATYLPTPGAHIFSLATEAYPFADTVRSPLQGESSRSHEASAMHLRISDGAAVVGGLSEYVSAGTRISRSLFSNITIDRIAGPESLYLRFAWDVRENRTGIGPRLWITNVRDNTSQGNIASPDSLPYNGLNLIVADLDGSAPGTTQTSPELVNNPGPEIILSRQIEGSDQIQVLIYRYNDRYPIANQSLGSFTRQRLRGRIVAAGDIVSDPDQRRELILLDRDSLRVLQLRSYVNETERIVPFNPELAEPFAVLASFGLGDSILTAAIADVEGDGDNDIVASTGSGTYLIGRLVDPAFSYTLDPSDMRLCPSDTIELAWGRRTVGGEGGIRVVLLGPDGTRVINTPSVLTGNRLVASPADLNVTVAGEYRLVVSDAVYPWLSDTSNPFEFIAPQLGSLRFPDSGPVLAGTELLDTVALRCVDDVRLEMSSDGSTWHVVTPPEGGISTVPGVDSAIVRVVIPCPPVAECGEEQLGGSVLYRLVSPGDTGSVGEILLSTESIELTTADDDTTRSRIREVFWDTTGVTCGIYTFTIVAEDGTLFDAGHVSASAGRFTVEVPEGLTDSAVVCVGCGDPDGCARGMLKFELPGMTEGDYIAPNPFSPSRRLPGENGASIVFSARKEGRVTIRIIDAGRSTVRQITQEMAVEPGRHRLKWDGTSDDGGFLANGTYFCVISFSTGESIILPFIVIQ